MGPIQLIDDTTGSSGPWGSFSSSYEAILAKKRHQLTGQWRIWDPRPVEERDLLMEIADPIIDALRPFWRSRQYDRMVEGEIHRVPDLEGSGLSRDTAMATRMAMMLAGEEGWDAVSGAVIGRDMNAQPHHWLSHTDGSIFDLCDPRSPDLGLTVINCRQDDDASLLYVVGGIVPPFDDLGQKDGWAGRLIPELIERVHDLARERAIKSELPACEI